MSFPANTSSRGCLVRIEPGALDAALNAWNRAWGALDEALALDGKTMKQAVDEAGDGTGPHPERGRTRLDDLPRSKKSAPCP